MRNSVLKFVLMAIVLVFLAHGAEYGGPRGQASPNASGLQVPLGFSPESFKTESRWEKTYLAIPEAKNCDRYLRQLTSQPHVAGTPGDRRVTEMIYEEFKGTGNMEIHLDRRMAEKRLYPALNVNRSGTRREELLLKPDILQKVWVLRRLLYPMDDLEATEFLVDKLRATKSNEQFLKDIAKAPTGGN